MKMNTSDVYQHLQDLHASTSRLRETVLENDWETVISILNEREPILQKLRKFEGDMVDNQSKKDLGDEIRELARSIAVLNTENEELLKSKMEESSQALKNLAKQKTAAGNLRSVSKGRTKQLFNLVQ